jgi:hypothetical protein
VPFFTSNKSIGDILPSGLREGKMRRENSERKKSERKIPDKKSLTKIPTEWSY